MYAKSYTTINNILEAARTLFIEKQYADVTIAEIAAAADISKGALYHHFSGKEAVYVKMMHHYLDEILADTHDSVENTGGSCRDRLRQSTLSFLQLPPELHGVLRLIRRDINLFKDPVRDDLIRAYQIAVPEQVESIIRDGIADGEIAPGDARLLSWQLVAIVEVALRPYSRSVLGNPQEMADFVTNMFFDGVALRTPVAN
jgi:AcrR family transcriptional regulator